MIRFPFIFTIILLLLSVNGASAENYYLQAVKSTRPDDEMLMKSREKVKEYKKVEIQDDLEVPPFHKRGDWETESLKKTFCTQCHLSPPHTKNLRSRAFLNMHTQFIACETCHMRPEGVDFDYQWVNYRDQSVVEADAGLFRQPINLQKKQNTPDAEKRKTDVLVKIAPFKDNQTAMILNSHAFAEQTTKIWETGSEEERVKRRAIIHQPLKEKGPQCDACHQKDNPLLDLNALGAEKAQAKRILNHIVPQFFKRYKEDDQKIRINSLLQ